MLTLGPLAFANAWLLAALIALPVLWWLFRLTPPAPREARFPAARLLRSLRPTEDTPARTPWWLLLLRLLLAALIIIGLAQPLLYPNATFRAAGPLLLVIDDGWAAAQQWGARQSAAEALVVEAARVRRPVILLTTAPAPAGESGGVLRERQAAVDASETIAALEPKPWPTDRRGASAALDAAGLWGPTDVVWLSDGLLDAGGADAVYALAEALRRLGPVRFVVEAPAGRARALLPPEDDDRRLLVTAIRPAAGAAETRWVRAISEAGAVLTRVRLDFAPTALTAEATLDVPSEARNQIARLALEDLASAGATVLLDERWRRRPVGVASGQAIDRAQPFLSDAFYLERALEPAGAVTVGRLAELISPRMSVIALADVGQIVGPERASLAEWIDDGGVLIRFAGEHMAEQVDDLVPVALRSGGRAMGGALSWEQPAHLAAFPETSPFAGLRVPEDVVVRRQVLAEPSPDLGAKTWAQLADGTPLVTAARLGKGWIVLVHVSANAEWSTLPLSGVFVEMLRRLVELSAGVATLDAQAALPPFAVLDGFGRLGPPLPATRAATPERLAEVGVGPDLPPGYYGTAEARRAVNLTRGMAALQPVVDLPRDVEWRTFDGAAEVDLSGWLLTAALLLTTLDLALSLRLRGYGWAVRARAALLAICAAALVPGALTPAWAGEAEDRFAIEATRETHLAYVVTGDAEVDTMSEAGLRGLTQWLAERTAVEAAPPMGVDPKRDELVFFPLLYWPLSAAQPDLSDAALARVDAYMRDGGTILFDTRDQGEIGAITDSAGAELIGPGTERLRALLARLDIPPLMPIPPDHVLTKTFYLLRDFPGRWDGGTLWIERDPTSENDGVSALVIGSHDWAAAWAVDEFGQPVAALVPGGERQRVLAFRFGTNLVMYALSGNYKADQVHVPAILERLGQ